MMNIEDIQRLLNNPDQQRKSFGTNIFVITSADDQEKLLSCLKSESIFVNLNDKIPTEKTCSTIKRSTNEIFDDDSRDEPIKKRKGDLTCVVCGGTAFGYNFNQITCESCKAFFRRNALHPIEKTKCLQKLHSFPTIQCEIRYDIKQKCQRCRLLKCFQLGMRKDLILTPEEKLLKQRRLEENRRLSFMQNTNNKNQIQNLIETEVFEQTTIKTEIFEQSSFQSIHCEPRTEMIHYSSYHLTENDHICLDFIRNAYLNALQSIPPVSSSMSLELPENKMSAYTNAINVQNYTAIKIINFIRQIPEFKQINENDRLILVKYNLLASHIVHYALTFDPIREIFYYDLPTDTISPIEEAFAQHHKSLFILCYGYEFHRRGLALIRSIYDLIDRDTTLIQLLMINIIFLKGFSAIDDQQPSLNDYRTTFSAHSKYTDLIFRYLIDKYSFDLAVKKMLRITELFIKIQRLSRDILQTIKSKVDVNHVNPLMKSFLSLT